MKPHWEKATINGHPEGRFLVFENRVLARVWPRNETGGHWVGLFDQDGWATSSRISAMREAKRELKRLGGFLAAAGLT